MVQKRDIARANTSTKRILWQVAGYRLAGKHVREQIEEPHYSDGADELRPSPTFCTHRHTYTHGSVTERKARHKRRPVKRGSRTSPRAWASTAAESRVVVTKIAPAFMMLPGMSSECGRCRDSAADRDLRGSAVGVLTLYGDISSLFGPLGCVYCLRGRWRVVIVSSE